MKKLILCAAFVAALASSCEKSQNVESSCNVVPEARLNLSVALSGQGTKASYTEAENYETTVNSVVFFVFDASSGKIDKMISANAESASVSTTLGKKKVWAIVNPPVEYDYITTESDLKSACVNLEDNSVSDFWFVMSGSKEIELTAGGGDFTVDVSRLVSRVCLNKVSVNLPASYQSVELSYVYLSNVRQYTNYGQTIQGEWVNFQGRKSSKIIDGLTTIASHDELTAQTPAVIIDNLDSYTPETPMLMYAMPNSSEKAPTGYDPSAKEFRTVLVAVVKIDGEKYYYPVVLNSSALKSNVSYSVSMTIASLGSKDPNEPVAKAALEVEINVEPWSAGAEYNEII